MTDAILDFATDESFRLKNWIKHRDDERHQSPYPHASDYLALDGLRFTRAMVFDDFDRSITKGIISTIKWGYPRGSLNRKWHALSDAFRSDALAAAVDDLRNQPQTAEATVARLNQCVKGLGTATTTKIAYFARLTTTEGRCLIYDSMVRRAIARNNEAEFANLRAALTRTKGDLTPRWQERTYGLYITSVHASAEKQGISPEEVELVLFRSGRDLPPL